MSSGATAASRAKAQRAAVKEQRDLEAKQRERISRAYARAEKAELDPRGSTRPNVRMWFQRDGVYTADAKRDADPKSLRDRISLPVKEYVVEPDNTVSKTLGKAALEAVKDREFCANCELRQPSGNEAILASVNTSSATGIPWPDHGLPGITHCCWCMAKLSFVGEHIQADPEQANAEQQEMIKQLTGGVMPHEIDFEKGLRK